jgi:hypothetical protein
MLAVVAVVDSAHQAAAVMEEEAQELQTVQPVPQHLPIPEAAAAEAVMVPVLAAAAVQAS